MGAQGTDTGGMAAAAAAAKPTAAAVNAAPSLSLDGFARFKEKLFAGMDAGFGSVAAKIDEVSLDVAAGGNDCDDPLDDDLRRVEFTRSSLRLLNALRRAQPGLLRRLADAGRQVGDVNPKKSDAVFERWKGAFEPMMAELGQPFKVCRNISKP